MTSTEPIPSTPCALHLRDGCQGRTVGIDPRRTCQACRARGLPASIDYSVVTGRDARPQVIVLRNAGLIGAGVHS